jgi:hypothetical protein
VVVDGRISSRKQGRLDILIERGSEKLAVLELKRPGQPLSRDDVEQGLSYARVLHPRPPIVIVSNGTETEIYATHSGEQLDEGVPDENALAVLMKAALQVAEANLADAISTLMGPGSDVWMGAVRAASELTIEELTGSWEHTSPTFTEDFHIPRKAAAYVHKALQGSRRVIAVEGAPLIGKTHVLRELVLRTRGDDDLAVLFVEASGSAAIGIADEVARILGQALGWRIGKAEAQHWMESLGATRGPTLVIAVDALGLEHEAIRSELEALTAKSVGDRLKFVIEADTSVVERLWCGESRRKETVFARRGERVEIDRLDDDEYEAALAVLGHVGATFMPGADKADEYRQPWLLRSMAASVASSPNIKKGMVAVLPPLPSLDLFHHARERFLQDALNEQAATFARAALDDYGRNVRSPEIILRSMHSFMVRKPALRDHADAADIARMERSGLIGTVLDEQNRPVRTGRIPELIASEIARLIAAELDTRMGDEEQDKDAADWLIGIAGRLPLGDLIGAQALIDLREHQPSISVAFLNRLLERRPSVRPLKPGSRAIAWIPEIGRLNIVTRADGITVMRHPSWPKGIEFPPDDAGETYGDLQSWLILSHLAGVPMGAMAPDERIVGLIHPAILSLVGTSPIPLRPASAELERSGHHTHDGPNGEKLPCRRDGIIEPITFSLLRFLGEEQDKADEWLTEACEEGSAALLNRISIALTQLASMNPGSAVAKWAKQRNQRVTKAFEHVLAAAP